ncbi:MAG: hypothetical protein ACTSU7_00010 [Candidatus Heimdallarchaeaceae archaeon]
MRKLKIHVKTISGRILTFNNVEDYKVLEGGFIEFIDTYTGKTKVFHAANVEFEEIEQ